MLKLALSGYETRSAEPFVSDRPCGLNEHFRHMQEHGQAMLPKISILINLLMHCQKDFTNKTNHTNCIAKCLNTQTNAQEA